MASTIQIKNSNTVGNAPSSLTQGELAINVNDGNLFYGNGSSVKQDFAVTNITASAISASGEIEANTFKATGNVDFNGDLDVDGTTNLDVVDIDGDVQLDGTFTVGVNGNGKDVRLYGQLTNRYVTWDQSQNHLKFQDNTRLGLGNGAADAAFDSSIIYDGSNLIIDSDTGIQLIADDNNIEFTGALTASGNISSSGTIFTDTLSSPSNDLQIPSDTVTITAGTAGDANLILHADTDNNDENDNPYMYYKQDGDGGVFGIIGLSGANDKWPDGTTLTGATANGMVIGMTGSASGTARQVTIAAGNSASIIVKNDADVQILESLIVDNNISASGDLISNTLDTKTNKLAVTSTAHGNHQGDVVFFGGTTSMDVGQIYNLNGAGGWTKAQANSQANSDALLAVALGAASDTNGMLLKGMVTLDHDPGTIGDPLYLSDGTAGQATSTAPNSTNDIVRLIGYCVDSTNGQIYFNPSNDFIKHA